jgi:hypothetical protein
MKADEPMRHHLLAAASTAIALLSAASVVVAARPEPVRAPRFQASLITAVEPCAAPNDSVTTAPLMGPSCHPAAPVDTVCTYDPASEIANGTFQAKIARKGDRQEIRLHTFMRGLGAGCEGLQLCMRLTNIRFTTPDCASGDPDGCTIPDLASYAPGLSACCLVQSGTCRIDSGIDHAAMANFIHGGDLTLAVGGAALVRINGPSLPAGPSFVTGILAP